MKKRKAKTPKEKAFLKEYANTHVCRICGFRKKPTDDFSQDVPAKLLEDK